MNINSPICIINKKSCFGYNDQNCISLENCMYKSSYVFSKCKLKDEFDCFYFTKDTKDLILKLLEPNLEKDNGVVTEDIDKGIVAVKYPYRTDYYYYNHWYVKADGDGINFECYTPEEFNETFELD